MFRGEGVFAELPLARSSLPPPWACSPRRRPPGTVGNRPGRRASCGQCRWRGRRERQHDQLPEGDLDRDRLGQRGGPCPGLDLPAHFRRHLRRDVFGRNPIVSDGVLYFSDAASNVYALDAFTGIQKWKRTFNVAGLGQNGGPSRTDACWPVSIPMC